MTESQERKTGDPVKGLATTPFFSVIIPTYNRSDLLREAIRSVLAQTFQDFEVIIVNDFSSEDILSVVKEFRDERLRYLLNQRCKGVSGARNTGIFAANGAWTAFLDSDDEWNSNKLHLVRERIRKIDQDTGVVYTGYVIYDFIKRHQLSVHVPHKDGWIQDDLLYSNYIGTFSVVSIRSDLLKAVGGCDERFCYMEDGDLYVRLAGLSKVASINEPLTYVRTQNRDRLSFHMGKRVDAFEFFLVKHETLFQRNHRARHRFAALIFLYEIKQGEWRKAAKKLPWTMAGIFLDMPNFVKTLWGIALTVIKPERIE